jgi:hypothetical protein
VFLTTEDPVALAEFLKAAPKSWKQVLVYKPAVSSDSSVHSQAQEAQSNSGASGRHALIALLLALEARYFVLTGASNWSRLINELRQSVLEIDCAKHEQRIGARRIQNIHRDLKEDTTFTEVNAGAKEVASTCATDVIDLQPHMKLVKHGFLRPVNDAQAADPIKGFLHNAPESVSTSARRLSNATFITPTHTSKSPMLSTAPILTPEASPIVPASESPIKAPSLSTTLPLGERKRVDGVADPEKLFKSHKRSEGRRSESRRLQEQEPFSRSGSSSTGGHEHSLHGGSCSCTFVKYTPAAIEARWTTNIDAWQVTSN